VALGHVRIIDAAARGWQTFRAAEEEALAQAAPVFLA